jgi:GNAT superfamily N-acetyltransferase
MSTTTIRDGTHDDLFPAFTVFRLALADLLRRLGAEVDEEMETPEGVDKDWLRYQTLYEMLMQINTRFAVAEHEGRIIGYARSIAFDEVRELTDFFVLPGGQARGVGRTLIERAFPDDRPHRSIIATMDIRAQTRYLKNGVYPYTINYTLYKEAEACPVDTLIRYQTASWDDLDRLAEVDRVVLGYRRDAIHRWLIGDRPGYLMLSGDNIIGYCYGPSGGRVGPCATLDPKDIPAALSFIENEASRDVRTIGFVVPGVNQTATRHLLGRGFRVDTFLSGTMVNKPFGQLDRYVITTPEFVL